LALAVPLSRFTSQVGGGSWIFIILPPVLFLLELASLHKTEDTASSVLAWLWIACSVGCLGWGIFVLRRYRTLALAYWHYATQLPLRLGGTRQDCWLSGTVCAGGVGAQQQSRASRLCETGFDENSVA
jgi:hypothetical protein